MGTCKSLDPTQCVLTPEELIHSASQEGSFPRNPSLPPLEVVAEDRFPFAVKIPSDKGENQFKGFLDSLTPSKDLATCHYDPRDGYLVLTQLTGNKETRRLNPFVDHVPPVSVLATLNSQGQFMGEIPGESSGLYSLCEGSVFLSMQRWSDFDVTDFSATISAGELAQLGSTSYIHLICLDKRTPTQKGSGQSVDCSNGKSFNLNANQTQYCQSTVSERDQSHRLGHSVVDYCGGVNQGLLQPTEATYKTYEYADNKVPIVGDYGNLVPVMDDPDYLATEFKQYLSRSLQAGEIETSFGFLGEFIREHAGLLVDLRDDLSDYIDDYQSIQKRLGKEYDNNLDFYRSKISDFQKKLKPQLELINQLVEKVKGNQDVKILASAIEAFQQGKGLNSPAEYKRVEALVNQYLPGYQITLNEKLTAEERKKIIPLLEDVKNKVPVSVEYKKQLDQLHQSDDYIELKKLEKALSEMVEKRDDEIRKKMLVSTQGLERKYLRPALEKVRLAIVEKNPSLKRLLNPYATLTKEELIQREKLNAGAYLLFVYARVLGANANQVAIGSLGENLPSDIHLPYRFVSYQNQDQPEVVLSHDDFIKKLKEIYRGIDFEKLPGQYTWEFWADWALFGSSVGVNMAALARGMAVTEIDEDKGVAIAAVAGANLAATLIAQVFDDFWHLNGTDFVDLGAIASGVGLLGYGLGIKKSEDEVRVVREVAVSPSGIRDNDSNEHE